MGDDVRVWGVECCFACHKDLVTPVHLFKARHMGIKKIHRDCFSTALYITLNTEVLLVVGSRNFEEIWKPRVHSTHKDPKQPELFDED